MTAHPVDPDRTDAIDAEKAATEAAALAEYRRTHSADGYPLGSPEYPNNREGRRALARTWKRANR